MAKACGSSLEDVECRFATLYKIKSSSSEEMVGSTKHFDADPDPAFHVDADPGQISDPEP